MHYAIVSESEIERESYQEKLKRTNTKNKGKKIQSDGEGEKFHLIAPNLFRIFGALILFSSIVN